jgi:hypothetical protein
MARQTQQIKKAARKPVKKVPKSSPSAKPQAAKSHKAAGAVKKQTKPKIEIDLQEVQRLAGLGLTQEEIAP